LASSRETAIQQVGGLSECAIFAETEGIPIAKGQAENEATEDEDKIKIR
jgi:hypothetical protein